MKTTVERAHSESLALGDSDANRRRWERIEMVVRVDYKTVDELFSDFARNINEGGVFVETDTPCELGSTVAMQFQVPGSEDPIQVMGRVARIADGDHREPPGMGIEFEDLDEQSRMLINNLVRNLRVRPNSE